MPYYSSRSKEKLSTCHEDLQKVFNEVIKYFDCTIVYGHRSPEEQFELFKRGRRKDSVSGRWVIDNKLEVVTYRDGYDRKSMHNYDVSKAVDVMPYPIDPRDTDRMYYFAGFVMGIAKRMGIELTAGADWDRDTEVDDQTFHDLPHFEIVEK